RDLYVTGVQTCALPIFELQAELSPVPTADPSIEHASECYTASAKQHSRLTSVFARPRVMVTLPMGFAFEASYIPPVQVGDAHPRSEERRVGKECRARWG